MTTEKIQPKLTEIATDILNTPDWKGKKFRDIKYKPDTAQYKAKEFLLAVEQAGGVPSRAPSNSTHEVLFRSIDGETHTIVIGNNKNAVTTTAEGPEFLNLGCHRLPLTAKIDGTEFDFLEPQVAARDGWKIVIR